MDLFVGSLLGVNSEFFHFVGYPLDQHNVNIYISLTTNNKNLVIKSNLKPPIHSLSLIEGHHNFTL